MATHITSADFVVSQSETLPPNREAHSSGVSWGAVIGGAFVAAALYLILLALGAGFAMVPAATPGAGASLLRVLAAAAVIAAAALVIPA